MDAIVLDDVPFEPNVDDLLRRLHVPEGGDQKALETMIAEALRIARPRALYREAYVESRGDDFVVVEGMRLTSRILRVNLDGTHRVFLYLATCGGELAEWAGAKADILERYWADEIMQAALAAALAAVYSKITADFGPGRTSSMNPGSLADWPIEEQCSLLALLGSPEEAIGVRLTDSFLMIPVKSISGLIFPTETAWENCRLCPRENCPGRRAEYDGDLYERRYG